MTPTLLLTNANIITLDPHRPRATAMLVTHDRITALGSDADLLPHLPPSPTPFSLGAERSGTPRSAAPDSSHSLTHLNLSGRTVIPSFCDSHLHLYWYGQQLLKQADLVGTTDLPDLLSRLSDLASRTQTGWIQGHGFDQSKLAERRFPTRADLDRLSKTRPILISRICGHATVVNSAALSLLSPAQRAAGNPDTGLYTETAADPFYAAIPPLTEDEMEQAILAASRVALRTGITSVHTLLDTPDQMIGYSRLHAKRALPLRVTALPPYSAVGSLHSLGLRTGFGDHFLRFGAAKFFSDGSLGAQTALLSSPYHDKPHELGLRIYDPQDLKRKCRDAHDKGFQLAIHAIGDQALRESLDAIEYALQGDDNRHHRHRIEHASLVPPDCLDRLAKLQIVVTCQPQFVTSDTWTPDRIGPERTPWAYPFKTLLSAGVPITLSSDCPVEKLDAFDCLAAATGRHPWSPDETLSPEQALRAYSLGSAYAAHQDTHLGSLTPGKLADFLILPTDPTTLSAPQLRSLQIDQVYLAGKPVTL